MRAVFLPIMVAAAFGLLAVADAKKRTAHVESVLVKVQHQIESFVSGEHGAVLSNGVYRLTVVGEGDHEDFTIVVENDKREVIVGADEHEADLTLTLDAQDLPQLSSGSLTFVQAIKDGVVKAEGNTDLLIEARKKSRSGN